MRKPQFHQQRRQATPSRLLLALLDRFNGWLVGWLRGWWQRRKAAWRRLPDALPRPHFEALEPRILMSADLVIGAQFQSVVTPAEQSNFIQTQALNLNLATPLGTDADGTQISVSFVGPGSASLTAQGAGYLFTLSGTDASSSVWLHASGGDGRVDLTGLQVQGALKAANLASADLRGAAVFNGAVASLSLGRLQGAELQLQGGGETIVRTDAAVDSRLAAPQASVVLFAPSWTVSGQGTASLEVAALRGAQLAGDLLADLTVLGSGITGESLGSVQVGGAIGGVWQVHGAANSIAAGHLLAGWRANFSSTLNQLVVQGDAAGTVSVSSLQLLQVQGSARNFTLLVGADLGSDAALGGSGSRADSFAAGKLGRLQLGGDLIDSRLLVGVDPGNGVLLDGDDRQLGGEAIGAVTVAGTLQGSTLIVASGFPASVMINGVATDPTTLGNFFSTLAQPLIRPTIAAALESDTGSSASDGITREPGIVADITAAGSVAAIEARFGAVVAYQAVAFVRGNDGRYRIDRSALQALNGGSLANGAYQLSLRARDSANNLSDDAVVSFVLDDQAPALANLRLDPAFDTDTPGDNATTADRVTLLADAPAGQAVVLDNGTATVTATADAGGQVSFADVALALGANAFTITATDLAGNVGIASLALQRDAIGGDTTTPVLSAALVNDTGALANDGISREVAITGRASDAVGSTLLRAALDPVGANPAFTDLSGLLQGDGGFIISAAQLDGLAGGTLAEGAHVLRLVAGDAAGNLSPPLDFAFTLDTTAPTTASVGVSAIDAVDGDTARTGAALVVLRGQVDPGARVSLAAQSLTATASNTGSFQLPGVALALGDNLLRLQVTDLAGNSASFDHTITRVAQTRADAVLDWNNQALLAIQRDVTDPPLATRTLAMMSLAVYDALAAIQGTPAYLVQRSVAGAVSADAAVAVASHRILSLTYPGQRPLLDNGLATSLALITDGAAKDTGIALGLAVADAVWATRQNDGATAFTEFPGSTALGLWRPTGPAFELADDPQWRYVAPFAISAPDAFRAPPPPALDTAAYAGAIEQVKRLGSATSTERSADQTEQAQFWADGTGSYTPPGHWNQIAAQVALAKGNSLSANARLFAQLNVALADAAIACWDTKYSYGSWRPETAIQNAALDGNPATTADPAWRSLLISPPHPDYVSGHSVFSAAAASILAATFGDDTAFSTSSTTLPGVSRSFSSFSQAAAEAGLSRVYGGIHTSFANQQGMVIGQQVSAAVLARFALTQDTQAPVVVATATPAAVNANLVLTGQVLDNLSGVASAQYRVDAGPLQNLVLDADGGFAITTALAVDGTADGVHNVSVIARDAAGNISSAFTRSFTLDTRAPVITLASLADGAVLQAGARMAGAADANGSALTQLNFRFDNGTVRSLVFDASTGAFDQALAIGGLDIGEHALTVTARDAAGNSSTLSRSVSVEALTAFRVSALTPASGSADIGVTQRPQVSFSRAVNTATLNSSSFYATGPGGAVLPATVVPSVDGSFAWLFITNPMPGGAQITVHVDGAKIRAAADGAFLDADGDGIPGGKLTTSFTTVSSTAVAGTKVVGKVVDPGPDLLPMTFDDVRRGPDGVIHTADDVFLNPIAHAKVFILGQEGNFVYTDANGNFELTGAPVGEVKLAVDGRTSSNAPGGVFFPEMVMALQLQPGIVNTAMGSMGSTQERLANADRQEIYLPRVATSVLQAVSNTATTVITVDQNAAPNLSDQQRQSLTLTINPGSAIGDNGQPVADAQIGISTVPPELVRDMLPPGILQHTFDITIQAPGVATFAEPVQISFPNVFNAAPGTQLSVLSFDHTTGMLVINGTATVSADGLTVVSDPDSGVRAPGWHGVTPPGGCGGAPTPPLPPHVPNVNDTSDPLQRQTLPLIKDEGGSYNFPEIKWQAPNALPGTPPVPPDPSGCPSPAPDLPDKKQPYVQVTVSVDGPLGDFMKQTGDVNIAGDSFVLRAGTGLSRTLDLAAKSFAELSANGIKNFEKNVLFGSTIKVEVVTGRPDGSTHTTTTEILLTRYVDATDDKHTDGQTEFTQVVADGAGGNYRVAPVEIRAGSQKPQIEISGGLLGGSDFFYADGLGELWFDPISTGIFSNVSTDSFKVKNPADATVAGSINLRGEAAAKQLMLVDKASIEAALASIAGGADGNTDYTRVSAAELKLIDNLEADGVTAKPNERSDLAQAVVDATYAFYTPYAAGIQTGSSSLFGDEIEITFSTHSSGGSLVSGLYGTSARAGGVDNVFGGGVQTVITSLNSYSKAEATFRLDNAMNIAFNGFVDVHPDSHLELWDLTAEADARAAYIQMLAETGAHEYGHTLSLVHAYKEFPPGPTKTTGPTGASDLMMGHAGRPPSKVGALSFTALTQNPMLMAANMSYNANQAAKAIDYYFANIVTNGGFSVEPGYQGDEPPPVIIPGPQLGIIDLSDGSGVFEQLGFGLQAADGAGGSVATRQLRLFNYGSEALTISSATLGNTAFTLSGLGAGTVIAAGQSQIVSVSFDPTTVGAITGTLDIASNNAQGARRIALSGFGQGTGAHLSVEFAQNNFGGVYISNASATRSVTLRNDGAQPLVISGLSLLDGAGDFALAGLPADLATTPITLAFGQSTSFDLVFNPSKVGLLRATVAVASNDASNAVTRIGATGTGFDKAHNFHWGRDFVTVDLDGNLLRTTSGADGRFEFFLAAEKPYTITVFDPVSGLVAHGSGTTPRSGQGTDLASGLVFRPSTAPDSDGDGLPDDIELAIGSNKTAKDTDRDGLDDYTEIVQGLDPLGGLGIPVGVVSVATVSGTAEAVTVIGSVDGSSQATALVATGAHGLAIVNAAQMTRPSVLAELDLPGINTDVAVDTVRQLAVLAGNAVGLHIVDIRDLSAPKLVQTVAFVNPVTRVEVRDGIAYVATGSLLATVDLNTGDVRQTLDLGALGGTRLTDLVFDGNTLFTMDASRTLRAISVAGDLLTVRDSIALTSGGGGRLFVGGGVAYIGTTDTFSQGYATVDVSDPADLRLLSGVDFTGIAGQALAANGSGLLVGTGEVRGARGEQFFVVDVSSSADPSNTNAFLTRINLPAAPKDLSLANGLAFVADGSGGLQIVNYVAFDTLGNAPTVTIAVDGVDADPGTPGVQVLEGRSLRVVPTISDDVQVRNVELLVNGKVVSNDVSFPFELFTQVPTVASGGNLISVQVRATDTGGNVTLSAPASLSVVPDTFAPNVTSISLVDDARLFFVRAIDIGFDEPIDPARLATSGVSLRGAGADGLFDTADDPSYPVHLGTRSFGQALSVVVDAVLPAGPYRFRLDPAIIADRAGNALTSAIERSFSIRPASDVRALSGVPEIPTAPSANVGQQIGIGVPFDPSTARMQFSVADAAGNVSSRVVSVLRTDAARGLAYFQVPNDAVTGDAVVYALVNNVRSDFADGTFPLQILPTISSVQIESVNGDGTVRVLVGGTGFIDGGNSEYRFGTEVVADPLANSGPDVFGRNDPVLGFVANGYVRLTLPLSDAAFGAVSVKTAGGSSAGYTVSLASIDAVAFSGTPADAAQASANAGQAVTLRGSGLNTDTDVLLRWRDISGTLQSTRLSPSVAAADGSSATLLLPSYANGAFSLQVLGSASQPLLQIVPTLTGFDQQSSLVLFGSGFVENASTYSLPGASVTDVAGDANTIDVRSDSSDQNRAAYLNRSALPSHGLGPVTVSTEGGTSAALTLDLVQVSLEGTYPGDVAIDATSGAMWVSDYTSPGHLLRIDPATGGVLQTITLSSAFGTAQLYNSAGLQVVPTGFTLGSTAVPAGSLLVFNGYVSPDRVIAVNPADGTVIASLVLAGNYDLSSGLYDAASGHLFITDNSGSTLREIDPATGAQIGANIAVPINVQTWSGMAIDPVSGNFWLGSSNGGAVLVEVNRAGTELRRINAALSGINQNEISGLAFAPDGKLWVSSTQGVIYRVDTTRDTVAVASATLSQVLAGATDGVAANTALPAANVGQVIELRGSNFGAGTTVLFNTRDSAGNTALAAVDPLVIDATGTRLQVVVPGLATTGEVRVVNRGSTDLGFSSYTDSVYRQITLDFTATASTAVIRFADGGLEDINNESWGIDNVSVKQGASLVFADDFEAGAAAQWGNASTDGSERASFSRFSGRFGNGTGSQTLNLGGLVAGQTYTLAFDLYALDSWDGTGGPDLFDVSVDGVSVLREALANYPGGAQTLRASAGIVLQVVPTLDGIDGSRPGEDNQFNLRGSGFMEGASTVSIGGVVMADTATNLSPFDVSGSRNDRMTVVAPKTLDGPIRISTDGGYAQIPAQFDAQPISVFSAINATAGAGVPADAARPSANTGQTIVLTGQGLTSSTLVQFQGVDDSGVLGTLTRTGSAGNNGTTLSVVVPALARSGAVTVLGSGTAIDLQVVPTLRSYGGTVAAGNTLLIEGSGLSGNDLVITVDGRAVGNFSRTTVVDGTSTNPDQQLIRFTVPTAAVNPNIVVSTGGGSASLQTSLRSIMASAGSGTAALASAASANAGQSIVVDGSGLLASDRLVFSTIDTSGNLGEITVIPTVDLTQQTLTVTVPDTATTGKLRLLRESGGLLLQIVPTVGGLSMGTGNFAGGTLTVQGSGFAEGAIRVDLAGQALVDSSRNSGLNVTNSGRSNGSLSLTLPTLASAGPVSVTTAGGTSASFSLGFTAIQATAGSGTPANGAIASANLGQEITLVGSGFGSATRVVFNTVDAAGNRSDTVVATNAVNGDGSQATVTVPLAAVSGTVRVLGSANAVALQIVPVVSDVQIESVAADGSSARVLVAGLGFVEGANSEYRFGSQILLDAGTNTGVDVFGRSDPVLGFLPSGYVRLTLPLSDGAFGAISVKTAGGSSADYTVALSKITSVAASGTPADAAQASANAGQSITLDGSGLNTSTDVLLRWRDVNGTLQTTRLSPNAAAADGSSATLLLPGYANGAFALQVLGSASQPLLQIVPTLTGYDQQSALVLFGSGFVENASTYSLPGASVTDLPGDANTIDVRSDNSDQNRAAYLNRTALPSHGLGPVTVSTEGGTSAALTLNLVQVSLEGTYPGDVAIDPTSGTMWVSDYANPGHLLRIDPATGGVLQTITLTSAFGTPYLYNHAGLQVLPAGFTLGSTAVPAGSLLVFNGYVSPDRVIAVNPADGTVIASLVLAGNYDLSSGLYDAASGHLFIADNSVSTLRELDPATGAQIGANITVPINMQTWSGMAIDPVSGNFWLGSSSGGAALVEVTRSGTEVRRIDGAAFGINQNEITGLAFAPDGSLWVSSTQGVIYRVLT